MLDNMISRRVVATRVGWAAVLALAATGSVPAQAVVPRDAPAAQHPLVQHSAEAAALRSMSLEEKVGQIFVQNVYGSDATTPDARNVPLYGVASPADVVRKYHLGGGSYLAWTDSVKDPVQITGLSNGLQRAAIGSGAHIPLTVGTDQ